ncbi:arsenate reductase/protein-tyrosine-phosphatase family protein [Geodermatophilus sp. SYSU D01036]
MTPGSPGAFEVLVVCTGNICRSPAAAAGLSAGLSGTRVAVSSAGLHACTGEPMAPQMTRLLDVPPPRTPARQVTPGMLARAGLVLGMTRDHRRALVTLAPAAVRRTFTLHEFTDLAELARADGLLPGYGPPDEAFAAVVAAAPRLRPRRCPGAPDDVEDPYGRDDEVFARVAAELRDTVGRLLAAIGTVPAAGTVPPA